MKTVTVKSYSLIERVNTDSTLYNIIFDDNTEALMLGREGEVEPYLDKLVDVEFRKDIYKGNIKEFVATIALRQVVNTINRREHIKLFSDLADNCSNVCFRDINIGDTVNGAVVYCNKVTYDSSLKTDWIDLLVSDKNRYLVHLRMFAPDRQEVDFAGSYIKCDIRRNKYGYNTQEITALTGEYPPNPEVDIAECYIHSVFDDDIQLYEMLERTNLLTFLKEHVGFEKGSLLITLAMEVDLAYELANITPALEADDLAKAFIVDKLWVLNKGARYPKEFLCLHRAIQFKSAIPPNVLDIICEKPAVVSPEREVYLCIKELVREIIRTRRGDVEID